MFRRAVLQVIYFSPFGEQSRFADVRRRLTAERRRRPLSPLEAIGLYARAEYERSAAMKVLALFRDVRSRLLALVALIIIPAALIALVLATAANQSLSSGIDRQRRQTTGDYAVRTRVWLSGAARTLSAAAASATSVADDENRCSEMLRDVLAVNEGYKAIQVDTGGGRTCVGGEDSDYSKLVRDADELLRLKPRVELTSAAPIAAEVIPAHGQSVLAIQADAPKTSIPKWTATALVDPILLTRAFELDPEVGEVAALMERGQKIVAASRADASGATWLPASEPTISAAYQIVRAASREGAYFDYATQPVLASDFYILSRFQESALRIAWMHVLVLALTPMIILAALYFAYSRAIQSELLRWIDGIKAAMLARKAGGHAPLAPESEEMPRELRDLASSFNEMARESEIREQSLKQSLAENEFLLRELHHRVKTSLQIIQSYLSLTRRLDRTDQVSSAAMAAMEARVQVISVAYRKALSEGRMRDVRIRQYSVEIVDNLAQSFQRPGLALELKADVDAALMIDRAIPLGLALVESVLAGLAADDAHVVAVRIGELDDLRVELRVSTDGTLAPDRPDAKLMTGLALQLDASVESADVGTILRWRFQAGPPPILVSEQADGRMA